MSAISEMIEVQARELAGLQGTVFCWLGEAIAWLRRDKAQVWLRLAAAAWVIAGQSARSGIDRRTP
jgi:hypothetical protein